MKSYFICLLILTVFSTQANQTQAHLLTPKKRASVWFSKIKSGENSCTPRTCLKRSPRQDEVGPFWANRGKKDPYYLQQKLYAEEPHWILVRRDESNTDSEFDPFFITRGKKGNDNELYQNGEYLQNFLNDEQRPRDRRNYDQDVMVGLNDISPFFAARGKKYEEKRY